MALEKLLPQRIEAVHVQTPNGYVFREQWTAPAAASATAILSAQSLASGGTVTTFAGQPDKPRTLQYVASGATTANVTVNGTDVRGNALVETVALNGTSIVHGTHAFASITSIVLPTVAATTLNVGTDVAFGLARNLLEQSVIDSYTDGAIDTTAPTVVASGAMGDSNISLNTITFHTAPNGTHNFAAYLLTTEVTDTPYTTS